MCVGQQAALLLLGKQENAFGVATHYTSAACLSLRETTVDANMTSHRALFMQLLVLQSFLSMPPDDCCRSPALAST